MRNAMAKVLTVVAALGFCACTPQVYEGDFTLGAADVSVAGDDCQGYLRGHFNVNDTATGVTFHATLGDVTDCNLAECDMCDEGIQWDFTYKYRGDSGGGVACSLDDNASISITTGPLAGYWLSDTLVGDLESTPCD